MRVLHVIPYYEPAFVYGGPVRGVSLLCRGLVRVGVDVTVYTTNSNGVETLDVPLMEPVDLGGVTVFYFPRLLGQRFHLAPQLGKACYRTIAKFDLVHLTAIWTYPMWPGARAALRCSVPYVVSTHGTLMPWDYAHHRWKKCLHMRLFGRRLLNGAAGIHCTCELEREEVIQFQPGLRTFVVPYIIRSSEFTSLPRRGGLRQRLGIPSEAKVILFLGRLSKKKGLNLVIEAFSQIAPLFEQVYLVIAGPDEEGWTERIQRWAYVQGLQHRVRLTGLLVGDERLAAFADADIFILTSYSESFGISVAEAMAAGLPVLVSNQVGIHPAIRSADAGLVVPLEVSAIAEGMGSLLIRSDLPAMGYRGRQLVRTYFSSDVVASQMIEAYEKILARSRTDHKPIACTKGHI